KADDRPAPGSFFRRRSFEMGAAFNEINAMISWSWEKESLDHLMSIPYHSSYVHKSRSDGKLEARHDMEA
ncbi:MAG: hypothetical protein KAU35_00830, partial [candidate division Zixibacteria bacterium]|nr:hypothetical protein [candidate division Zixibacteria bacterium]